MGNRRVVQYVYQRGITCYLVRRVPKDVQRHYKSSRVVICLKTSRCDQAVRAGMSIAQRLEDYWLSLRLAYLDIPGLHLLRDRPLPPTATSSRTLHDALELYLRQQNHDDFRHLTVLLLRVCTSVYLVMLPLNIIRPRAFDERQDSDDFIV
jgi:hypothetical protein